MGTKVWLPGLLMLVSLALAGQEWELVWEGELEGDDPNEMLAARLVCDWSMTDENIDLFLSHF